MRNFLTKQYPDLPASTLDELTAVAEEIATSMQRLGFRNLMAAINGQGGSA